MENRNQEVTSFVATFENHYKAMLFRKGMGAVCTLRPVPRCLSSSCGTAAFFTLEGTMDGAMDSTKSSTTDSTKSNAMDYSLNCPSNESRSLDALSQELKALVESIYELKNGEYHEIYKN